MRYCDAQYEKCARYQASKRGETVPPTLLPNGRLLRRLPVITEGDWE
jgi:hypothetical protein